VSDTGSRGLATIALMMLALLPAQAAAAATAGEGGALGVTFEGLRSSKGMLRVCLTRNRALFLKCENDPEALRASVAASPGARVSFDHVPPGDYALLVLHDENGNAKIDTLLGIPREGVGFSRNPKLSFGPPKFDAVRIRIGTGPSETDVTLKYFL